jgi:septum formation protein
VALSYPACWVLAADTIVVLEGRVFGKPADPAEAAAMLRQLGGREHEVYTGICLQHLSRHHRSTQVVTTRVQFKRLTDAEIRAYVATGEPLDKAGAYGIQGMGAYLVRALHGSYTNVVGLPLCETVELLTGQGIIETC